MCVGACTYSSVGACTASSRMTSTADSRRLESLSRCSARLSSGSTASLPPACASMPRACEADCSTELSAEAPKGSRTKLAKLVSLIVDFRSVGDLAGPQGALFRG